MKSTMEYRDRRMALVLVDIQRKFTEETSGLRESMLARVGTVNEAIELFRSTGNPVVYVYFDGEGHCLTRHVEDADATIGELLPQQAGDLEFHKTGMNSFNGTGLGEALSDRGVDTVLIAGLVAQYCVMATYYGAFDKGISPYLLEGGVAATDERNVELVESLCKTLSVDELRENVHFRLRSRERTLTRAGRHTGPSGSGPQRRQGDGLRSRRSGGPLGCASASKGA